MSTIDNFKEDIIASLTEGSTHAQLLEWLQTRGIGVSESTLRRRLEQWGCRRKANGPASSDSFLASTTSTRTLWSDTRIAKALSEELGLKVTRNQVQEIRLGKGWLRRTPNPNERVERQLETNNKSTASFTPVLAVHTVA